MARDPPPPEPHRSFANALCVPLLAPQARLTSIKDSLDARDTGRGDSPEVAVAKARLNEIKTKSRMLQQEKRNIYDQIAAADELKKQQQDLTQRLRSELGFFSVEEIDRKIKVRCARSAAPRRSLRLRFLASAHVAGGIGRAGGALATARAARLRGPRHGERRRARQ